MPRPYSKTRVHGTRSMYANYGCRCPACTRANADYQREYCRRPERKAYNRQNSRGYYHRTKRARWAGETAPNSASSEQDQT